MPAGWDPEQGLVESDGRAGDSGSKVADILVIYLSTFCDILHI